MKKFIADARNAVPKSCFECPKGCYKCCTSINFTAEEKLLMLKELRKNGYVEAPRGKGRDYCEYLDSEGKCSVYNERPFICRAFGSYKMPHLACSDFGEKIFESKEAKDNFYEVEMTYMKELFAQGSLMNEGGAVFRSSLDPFEEAISKGPKGIVPFSGILLKLLKEKNIEEEYAFSLLTKLEGAMRLANDTLENYFNIKIIEGK